MKKIFYILTPYIILIILSYCPSHLTAQRDTILMKDVEAIIISASRIKADQAKLPMAIGIYQADAVQSIRQQLSLQEYVATIPGLYSLNANNYAQDLRISIRGFGARAAFGIRGIKIIVDGVPETTPDGQGQIDNLNLSIIDRIEVIRGPASSLYGNAAGGVIHIKTKSEVTKPYMDLGMVVGSYGMLQYQAEGGLSNAATTFIGQGSYNTGDGYRVNSGYKHWNFNGKLIHKFSESSKLNVNLNYSNSPQADDPGAVTLETRIEDPTAARDRNLQFNAGEEISQLKASLSYNKSFGNNELSLYGFGATRDFLGFLPFSFGGVVDLERRYYGLGGHYSIKQIMGSSVNTIQLGFDYASQDDARMRFINLDGIQGDLTLDRNEIFSGLGIYLLDHWDFGKLVISAGLRIDRNEVELVDNIVNSTPVNADFNSLNPSVGLSFDINETHNMFANYSRSFETPSLTELFADPNGGPGLNEDLKPQTANSFELGIRGRTSTKWSYEAVLYRINTTNDLVPFEVEQQLGLTFYRNAGKTIRQGIELMSDYQLNKDISLQATYTYSDFTYDEFNTISGDFSGNLIPGIPKHHGNISLKGISNQGFIYHVEARFVGSLTASDNNAFHTDSYTLVNAQFGYRIVQKKINVNPFVGVNNILNVDYNDNIRINAFGGRHFEAGPHIHLFGGVKVRF